MKTLILLLSFLAGSVSFAGNLISDEATAVGAEVILRQIATPKHFGVDGLRAVKAALEGSGSATYTADIKSINCEPSLGSKDCVIGLQVTDFSRPDGFQDLSFDIQAKIYQGKVVSGGPVPVEL